MKDPDHPEPSAGLQRFLRIAQRSVGLAGEVNVRIASNREMRRLNREFRGKDKPTDVLSFPAFQNGKANLAGDVAISADIARMNAKELGHSLEEELNILLLHGLLHLAGHDHESDNGEMRRLEQKLRAKLNLPAGLIERSKTEGPTAAPGRVFRRASQKASGPKHASEKRVPKRESLSAAAKAVRTENDLPARLRVVPLPEADGGNELPGTSTKNPAEGGRRSFRASRSS